MYLSYATVTYLSISNSVISEKSVISGYGIGNDEGDDSYVQDLVIFDSNISASSVTGPAIVSNHDFTLAGRVSFDFTLAGRVSFDLEATGTSIQANSTRITSNATITAHVSSGPLFSPAPSTDVAF
jgi:hypothetical protein